MVEIFTYSKQAKTLLAVRLNCSSPPFSHNKHDFHIPTNTSITFSSCHPSQLQDLPHRFQPNNVLVQPQPPTLAPSLIVLLTARLPPASPTLLTARLPTASPTLLRQQRLLLQHLLSRELQPRKITLRLHQCHGLEDQAVPEATDGLCAPASYEAVDDDITLADGRSTGGDTGEVWDQVAEGVGKYRGWGEKSCGDGWKWARGCWRGAGVDKDCAAVHVKA